MDNVDLVGRDTELRRLRAATTPGQVVAVGGPPGVGKTALVRAALEDRDRVVWVSLDEARTANDAWAALGRVLGVSLAVPERAPAQIARALRDAAVVVLDGADLLDDSAWDALAGLRRERPAVAWVVGAVVAPAAATASLQLAPLAPDDAHRMLLRRASARSLGRPVDEGDPAWATLAERLDGLPLALELAAGRLSLMSPGELLDRLDVAVLRGSDRRTSVEGALRFAWSLLGPADQRALVRLSLARGFTLGTAEALLGEDALETLERLRSRSALGVRDGRLYVLEGLRRIALRQVDDEVRDTFVSWWIARAQALRQGLRGPREAECAREIGAELPNLRAAFDLAREAGRAADAVSLGLGCAIAIRMHGPLWSLDELPDPLPLARAAPGPVAAQLLTHQAGMALQLGRSRQARELLAEALRLADLPGSESARSLTYAEHGWQRIVDGDLAAGRAALEEALRCAPDGPAAALALNRLATVEHNLGDVDAAIRALEGALAHLEGFTAHRLRGTVRLNLGILRAEAGRCVEAEDLLRGAAEELAGVDERGRADALMSLGRVALATGRVEAAAAHLAVAGDLDERYGSELSLAVVTSIRALERWAAGDRASARALLAAACERQREADPTSYATNRAWRAALEADAGRVDALAVELAAARADGAYGPFLDLLAAFGGSPPPPATPNEPLEMRIARQLLSAGRPALRCDRTGRWFERPGERVDLARRGALQRILAALIELRVASPGVGMSVQQVFEAGWPGDRAHPDAASARVYTAVRELRALGVGDMLRRESQGYLLDPAARIDVQA